MRVLFAGGGTGGHLYPGLAIARALVRADPTIQPFFVGARRGIERTVLPQTEFPHLLLDLHPLYRRDFWNNWKTIAGAISAWRGLASVVAADRPALVVGTGGYAAGLAMAYAATHGIPIVQQAGDSHPGLTARFFASRSREIYLNFPEAGRLLRAHPEALITTGAPIEPPPAVVPDRASARAHWGFPGAAGHVLLVYGGSQGSLAINNAVAEWIQRGLPDDLHVIWGTGRGTFERFKHLESSRVRVTDYLAPIAQAYAATDVAIARAGAMTTAELLAWSIPAILVPLPTAAADHQTQNADTLQRAGAAVHLPQSMLSAQSLASAVESVVRDDAKLAYFRARAAERARPHAAADIASRILNLIGGGRPS